jgi:hypothetical protein
LFVAPEFTHPCTTDVTSNAPTPAGHEPEYPCANVAEDNGDDATDGRVAHVTPDPHVPVTLNTSIFRAVHDAPPTEFTHNCELNTT